MVGLRVPPRDVAAVADLTRRFDRARERVTRTRGLARIVEARRDEVRDQHAVDRVGKLRRLAGIARLYEELHLALTGLGRAPGGGAPAEWVDEHLEHLMARRQRP